MEGGLPGSSIQDDCRRYSYESTKEHEYRIVLVLVLEAVGFLVWRHLGGGSQVTKAASHTAVASGPQQIRSSRSSGNSPIGSIELDGSRARTRTSTSFRKTTGRTELEYKIVVHVLLRWTKHRSNPIEMEATLERRGRGRSPSTRVCGRERNTTVLRRLRRLNTLSILVSAPSSSTRARHP